MNRIFARPFARNALSLALATGLVFAAAAPALSQDGAENEGSPETAPATQMTEGEKRLARLLEGRVAGEPVSCIRALPTDRMTVIEKTAYVYQRGGTIYVQRTQNPEDIDSRDTLVSQRFGANQICRQDVVTTIDAFTGFFTGAVFFEQFVPYTKADKADL